MRLQIAFSFNFDGKNKLIHWTHLLSCADLYLLERAGEKVDERQPEDDPQHPALPQ